jgi:F-type H+-transporting ATPase subunit gamma
MPSTREIRRRIRSAKNISQITRAMEMVAASRMKRATQQALSGRPYSQRIGDLIRNLSRRLDMTDTEGLNPLLLSRPIKNITVIVFTADKGLAGALNTNILRRTTRFILNEVDGVPVNVVAVGRKGRDFMIRYGRPLLAEFTGLGDRPTIQDIRAISRVVTDEFVSGRTDAVYLIYTDFINTLLQRPNVYRLLPIDISNIGEGGALPGVNQEEQAASDRTEIEYEYEPGGRQVLAQLVPRYIEVRLYQALLEHLASEHSSRMVAMRNATQNAKEMISDLTLSYNKLRQANITSEIIEVSSGAAAQAR